MISIAKASLKRNKDMYEILRFLETNNPDIYAKININIGNLEKTYEEIYDDLTAEDKKIEGRECLCDDCGTELIIANSIYYDYQCPNCKKEIFGDDYLDYEWWEDDE